MVRDFLESKISQRPPPDMGDQVWLDWHRDRFLESGNQEYRQKYLYRHHTVEYKISSVTHATRSLVSQQKKRHIYHHHYFTGSAGFDILCNGFDSPGF